MTKYKRWILLLTALTVFVVHVESLKATSLIHAGKFSKLLNTTTTTTTTEDPSKVRPKEMLDETSNEEMYVEVNGTKIALTGIPQIDYVWDPNLPRELNGFNLSNYPFIDSMPAEEDIGFNCDDKINGFYASIKFGCQIYHHCLYGVRSDFICANFTAFDQKTFICHFASEVDCKNSYKYWSRNDDLYKATTVKSTTLAGGLAPLFDRNLYKRPAPGSAPSNGASKAAQTASNNNSPLAPLPLGNLPTLKSSMNRENNNNAPASNVNVGEEFAAPVLPRPANRPLRRPYRRRRPQIDYYYYEDEYEDDFYDDRGRRRQQRPRNRRPIYDDYESRRPDRRPLDDDFDDYEYDRRPYRSRNRSESRRNGDDRRKYEDRRFDDKRRPNVDDRKTVEDRRRPDDERRSYDDRRFSDDQRQTDDRKRQDEERSQSGDRKSNRRRNQDDLVDDKRRERIPERSEPTEKRQVAEEPSDDKIIRSSTSLFDRPRPSSKIARPVLLNEKNKFSNKPSEKPSSYEDQKKKDDEYYEEYDDPIVSSTTTTTTVKTTTKGYSPRLRTSTNSPTTKKPSTTTSTTTAQEIEYYEDEDYENFTPQKPVETSTTTAKPLDRSALFNSRNRPTNEPPTPSSITAPAGSSPDNFRLNRFKSPNEKIINETAIRDHAQKTNLPYAEETSPSSLPSSTSRKPLPSISYDRKKFAIKQTVFESTTTETPKTSTQGETFDIDQRILLGQYNEQSEPTHLEERDQKYVMRIIKRPFLPSRGGNPYKPRGLQPVGPASQSDQTVEINNQQFSATGSELSPPANDKTQHNNDGRAEIHKTTLEDIYNEEYDVELNDALNPHLKPLTSSRGISGFSFSSLPNDDKDGYRSQSRQVIQKTEAPKPALTPEQPQYEYEEVEYDYK